MRETKTAQFTLGQEDIARIKISTKTRDDIPDVLRGLQHIYITDETREALFASLDKLITDKQTRLGRTGLDLWSIFVMATLRVGLNWDYDRLHQMVNEHKTIRKMLGHGSFDDDYEYGLQRLKDNVSLLTPEALDEINQAIIEAGHELVKKKRGKPYVVALTRS